MRNLLFKSAIIAACLIALNCDNNSTSITTLHPLMDLKEEKLNNTTRVIISTTVAKDYSMYRIISDSCTINYPWVVRNPDSSYSPIIDTVKIANDSSASQSGTFHGIWVFPDSLFTYGSLRIKACLLDETKHIIDDTLTVH